MANEKSAGVKYTFGIAEEAGHELLSYESYSIVNLIGEYQIKKDCGMKESDAVAYKVKTREIFYLGDFVRFLGKNYVVGEVERNWEGNEVYNYYLLETRGELRQMPYGNKKIIGASLKGNVTAVKKDTVKVVLMEDETGGWAGQKWFAYSTIYSSPDGTGWYCMPEKGDSVRLYFPNENEAEAYVNSSVNEQSSNSSGRSNPDEKSIKNKQGKEVLFKPDRLVLTNNNGMSIEIVDDEGILIESNKSITIKAKENIGIISMEQGVEMAAPEKIAFQAMAVFRVERNTGYTVMSNHHLRNKELTLKAKGLLSQMLSLPEDWDYTLAGLSHINREKIDAIREAVRELERAGYIVRSRERDAKGRLRGADYVIYEQPQLPPTPDLPTLENPMLENPTQEKPTLEKPTQENPMQLNKDKQRTDLPNKEKLNTDTQSTHLVGVRAEDLNGLRVRI